MSLDLWAGTSCLSVVSLVDYVLRLDDKTFVFSLGTMWAGATWLPLSSHSLRGYCQGFGWGGPCLFLAQGFGGFALTFAGNKLPLRLCKSLDLWENKRPPLWPIYGRTFDLSLMPCSSKQSSALAMCPLEFKVTSEEHKGNLFPQRINDFMRLAARVNVWLVGISLHTGLLNLSI